MRTTFVVRDETIRRRVGAELSRMMREGETPQVVVSPFKADRSLDQNAIFHAIVADVARQAVYLGRKLPAESWKALFVSGHAIATQQPGEVLPGLEGEFVAIRESTSRMSKERATSLIEYVLAWCAQNGIELREESAA